MVVDSVETLELLLVRMMVDMLAFESAARMAVSMGIVQAALWENGKVVWLDDQWVLNRVVLLDYAKVVSRASWTVEY